ncbi:hypothetical protein V8F06_004550 [Rhypophila decipiens]
MSQDGFRRRSSVSLICEGGAAPDWNIFQIGKEEWTFYTTLLATARHLTYVYLPTGSISATCCTVSKHGVFTSGDLQPQGCGLERKARAWLMSPLFVRHFGPMMFVSEQGRGCRDLISIKTCLSNRRVQRSSPVECFFGSGFSSLVALVGLRLTWPGEQSLSTLSRFPQAELLIYLWFSPTVMMATLAFHESLFLKNSGDLVYQLRHVRVELRGMRVDTRAGMPI